MSFSFDLCSLFSIIILNVIISMGENAVLSHLVSNIHNYSNLYACTFKDKKNCLIEKIKCKYVLSL